MAELNPLNVKLLTKEDRRSENDQHHQRHKEKPRLKAQWLPKIANKRKDRERDGENLIEENTNRKGLDQFAKNCAKDSEPDWRRARWCVTKPKIRSPRKFGTAKVSRPKSPNCVVN